MHVLKYLGIPSFKEVMWNIKEEQSWLNYRTCDQRSVLTLLSPFCTSLWLSWGYVCVFVFFGALFCSDFKFLNVIFQLISRVFWFARTDDEHIYYIWC